MSCCSPCHLDDKLLSNSGQFKEIVPSDGSATSKPSHLDRDYALEGSPAPSPVVSKMLTQLESDSISEDQLANDARGIYAELVIVEKRCIEVDNQHAESKADLSKAQWQGLFDLHQTLLYMHHDFFLASQHPSASPALKALAEKYAMPARMWRYGIYSFLELLRQRLPTSSDYMFRLIYFAYSRITFLLESISVFRETWIECLGDLARFGTAAESDMRDRAVWKGVSRHWYSKNAGLSPEVGRIQHHLGVLAWPDLLQQLCFYTKALVSVRPFHHARVGITLLFTPDERQALDQHTMTTYFIATHRALFMQAPRHEFITLANHFLASLRREIRQLEAQDQQAVYIVSCNIASILQYGEPGAVLALEYFKRHGETSIAEAHVLALEPMSGEERMNNESSEAGTLIQSAVAYHGSSLAFHTLSVFLDQVDDPSIYPSLHLWMAFIWCMALHPPAMQQLERYIPWIKITSFLNSLFQFETITSKIEQPAFPLLDHESTQQLPEDSLIRGQSWSQLYYPDRFFEDAPLENDRPLIQKQWAIISRRHRCLWLGVRIATFGRWITYGDRQFYSTQLAQELGPIAEECGNLDSTPAASLLA